MRYKNFVFIMLVVMMSFAPLQASSGVDGVLSVSFSTEYTVIDASALGSLVNQAILLRNDTLVSGVGGTDIHHDYFWASPAAHYVFNNAILSAQETFYSIDGSKILGSFSPAESFDMTLRIDDNTGFGVMATRLYIPAGLELTHISLGIDMETDPTGFMNLNDGITFPQGHNLTTGEIHTIIGPASVFVHWARTSNFTVSNTPLLIYTFRVSEGAAQSTTAPITFTFEDIRGSSPPSDINDTPLNISLPGSRTGVIGSVEIRS